MLLETLSSGCWRKDEGCREFIAKGGMEVVPCLRHREKQQRKVKSWTSQWRHLNRTLVSHVTSGQSVLLFCLGVTFHSQLARRRLCSQWSSIKTTPKTKNHTDGVEFTLNSETKCPDGCRRFHQPQGGVLSCTLPHRKTPVLENKIIGSVASPEKQQLHGNLKSTVEYVKETLMKRQTHLGTMGFEGQRSLGCVTYDCRKGDRQGTLGWDCRVKL